MQEQLVVEYLGGLCPVQGEGTLNDQYNWYFRARYDYWEFILEPKGTNPLAHYFSLTAEGKLGRGTDATYYYREPYGETGGFQAGYMPLGEATGFIEQACTRFLTQREQRQV